MIGDDAWFVVDKYLDDAVLAGISSVRIIHGKGTGALRAALWKYFKSDKRIATYRHGAYGEGDAGVTVIELKR
jgi:DNA mismatch repair protein MutS2